jgi:MOSC domain-containing protein YiiM
MEQIERANRQLGLAAAPGSYGEHLTVAGIDLRALSSDTLLRVGDTAILQIVRRGIPPGSYVAYSYQGYPLLAVQGVFCKVLRRGNVETGDAVEACGSAS